MEKIYNVQFVGLTPVENTGQVSWGGEDPQGALDALVNYLTGVYGPDNFKITYFKQAEEVEPGSEPFKLPTNPITSKVIN